MVGTRSGAVGEVILVEGLFDYAVLWQSGLSQCHLQHGNSSQRATNCGSCPTAYRTLYLAFDADSNGSGQQAAQNLTARLRERGLIVRNIPLPEGHDPNSWFVQGGDAQQFQSLLEKAQL